MNGRSMRTTSALALAFALFFPAMTATFAADAPQPADKPEDDKQRIARLEQRIEDLQKQIAELQASHQARQNKMPAGCVEECQAQIDELQASRAQQNELLATQAADIHALKEGRTGDLGRQVRALKERLDALERPVR